MADPGIPSIPLKLPIKLQLFDTLEQRLKEFRPIQPPQVKMYVCGPTVYDAAHLGHARTYITWDVLYRFLKVMGFEVTYVRNVTDVDDKIIQRSKELSVLPEVLAQTNYESFQRDMQALNVLPPTLEPKATLYIDKMIEGIQVLVDKGAAYPTPDGTVYFRTSFKREYGELSKKTIDDLQSGARVEVDPNKENPTDFALWKGVKNDEPPLWPTPWGLGRPGWHMECSAMAYSLLGEQLDIHAGGADLIFPHHENEIAQSEAWTGHRPFVNYWLHNGFVNVEGEKMSKSLGNFSTIQKLLERYDANTIRYFLLTHHYRMPVEFSGSSLEGAENRVTKIHRTLKETALLLNITETQFKGLAKKPHLLGRPVSTPTKFDDPNLADPLYTYFHQFVSAMAEDLNSPQA
ncbi:MAG: cysteine--tRNA ligase, partial [Cyanobacteria bacterium]|nr:cysteine--tRNA ligase [Cyanobacteriota bacterium]